MDMQNQFPFEINSGEKLFNDSILLKISGIIDERIKKRKLSLKEFFEFAQYSFFPHKLTGIKTNFRLFKHFDPHVIDFVSENLSKMDE